MSRDSAMDSAIKVGMIQDTVRLVDPLPFDREALVEILSRRLEESARPRRPGAHATAGPSSEAAQLDEDLTRILYGRLPRKYGEMPANMGRYERMAPDTPSFVRNMKLKRAHFRPR